MNTYRYKPYYDFKGPTIDDPLKEILSEADQVRNLSCFYEDVVNAFCDEHALVTREHGGVVSIQTSKSKQECDAIVAQVLISLDLLGKKL